MESGETEAMLASDQPSVVAFQIDSAGKLKYLSQEWSELTGLDVQEGIGQDLLDYLEDDTRDAARTALNALGKGSAEQISFECRIKSALGSSASVTIEAKRFGKAVESKAQAVGMITKRSAYYLPASQMPSANVSAASALDPATNGIVMVDSAGAVIWFNQRFLEIWGFDFHLNKSWSSDKVILLIAERTIGKSAILDCMSRKDTESSISVHAGRIKTRDGRVIEARAHALFSFGEPAGFMWTFCDVSSGLKRGPMQ